ncbi:insulinase family protein [Kaistella anthropi]|nr:insulinase family protein [Kaistella anthropi]
MKEGVLSNGMKYGLVNKELKGEKIIANFKLLIGNEKELAGKSSVGALTAALLSSGTKTKTKEQIQDRLDQLNSSIYFRTSGQNFLINVSTYKNNFAEVMDILQDILANATFPQNELTKMIAENNTYLEAQQKDPQAIASNELQRLGKSLSERKHFLHANFARRNRQ